MRNLKTFMTVVAVLQIAAGAAVAGNDRTAGNGAPVVAHKAKPPQKHRAKSSAAAGTDSANKDTAKTGFAGTTINSGKNDPTVNKVNTVLPP